MAPEFKLSSFANVVVGARLSKSGNAMPQSGDLEGLSAPLNGRSSGIEVVIDTVRPRVYAPLGQDVEQLARVLDAPARRHRQAVQPAVAPAGPGRRATRRHRSAHVGGAVADHQQLIRCHAQSPRGALQHRRCGLAQRRLVGTIHRGEVRQQAAGIEHRARQRAGLVGHHHQRPGGLQLLQQGLDAVEHRTVRQRRAERGAVEGRGAVPHASARRRARPSACKARSMSTSGPSPIQARTCSRSKLPRPDSRSA